MKPLKIKGYEKIKTLGMWDVVETDISYVFTKTITHLDTNLDITNKEITHSLYRSDYDLDDNMHIIITTLSTEDGEVLRVDNRNIPKEIIGDINQFVEFLKLKEKEILK